MVWLARFSLDFSNLDLKSKSVHGLFKIKINFENQTKDFLSTFGQMPILFEIPGTFKLSGESSRVMRQRMTEFDHNCKRILPLLIIINLIFHVEP